MNLLPYLLDSTKKIPQLSTFWSFPELEEKMCGNLKINATIWKDSLSKTNTATVKNFTYFPGKDVLPDKTIINITDITQYNLTEYSGYINLTLDLNKNIWKACRDAKLRLEIQNLGTNCGQIPKAIKSDKNLSLFGVDSIKNITISLGNGKSLFIDLIEYFKLNFILF